MKLIIIQAILFASFLCARSETHCDYLKDRNLLKTTEIQNSLGGDIELLDKETSVNNCLMQHKLKELDSQQYFNFSQHFFMYKDRMRQSKVYKIIQQMPKGAALHLHSSSLLGADYLMNITYMDNLYVCFDEVLPHFQFSKKVPTQNCKMWQLMSEARRSAEDLAKFDKDLTKHLTMVVDNPEVVYRSNADAWIPFRNYFTTIQLLLSFRPVWEKYIYDALKKCKEDNIMYIEIRTRMTELYELNGTVHDQLTSAKYYRSVIQRFVTDNPDFIGAKIIFSTYRHVDKNMMDGSIQLAIQMKDVIPEVFAGFDIVGHEDLGLPLIEFASQLLAAKDLNYFFHAGETDWYGTQTDENLIDAILLGAKRIGHGYALAKHPLLMKEVIQRNIALEVSVISNTVLSLVRDVRNHPLSIFLANGLPVVLSSDNFGQWDAAPLSDDFYVAFLGVSSRHSDLRLLKTLAINSLTFSALEEIKKKEALNKFDLQWNRFIDEFDCSKY